MTVATFASSRKPSRSAPRGPLLFFDPNLADDAIGQREFGVRHALVDHPLLTLEAIGRLADALPSGAVERHAAKQPLLAPGGAPDVDDGRPSEVVRTIETNGRWMVLWNVEQLRAYRELLDRILDVARPHLPGRELGMGRREAFLFLSAPNAITPVHFDPEHNFLLQIRGTKTMNVGRFRSRADELHELDRYHDGGHRNLESVPPLSSTFQMHPGEGVYVYPWAPHWVENGPEVSVSLSITFRTGLSERQERVHRFNAKLRRNGLAPVAPGVSDGLDRMKAGTIGLVGWLRRAGRRQRGARDYS